MASIVAQFRATLLVWLADLMDWDCLCTTASTSRPNSRNVSVAGTAFPDNVDLIGDNQAPGRRLPRPDRYVDGRHSMEDCQQQREQQLQEGDRDHDNFVESQQRILPGLPPKMSLTLTRRGHEQHRPRPRPFCSTMCHLGNSSCPTQRN